MIVLAVVAVVIVFSGSGAADVGRTSPDARIRSAHVMRVRDAAPESCLDAQRGIRFYRARTNELRLRFSREIPDRIRWPTCRRARAAAKEWRNRAVAARTALGRWYRSNYLWREWLPENWRRLGACETGYGREPGNFRWDSGRFVSAFGIYRAGYADDAHRIGALSWDETIAQLHRRPTPREQYDAALSHYRAHGDGWGCPGP